MALRGVVAEYMSYDVPSFLTASDYSALKLGEWLGICIVLNVGVCEDPPDISTQPVSDAIPLEFPVDIIPQ